MSKHKDHASCRRMARGEQRFRGFHDGDESPLVVERTATPDLAVDNRSGEWRMPPALRLRNRHDILVRHEDDGLQRGVCALPFIDERALAHQRAQHGRVKARIGVDEPGAKIFEGFGIRRIVVTDRLEAQRGAKIAQPPPKHRAQERKIGVPWWPSACRQRWCARAVTTAITASVSASASAERAAKRRRVRFIATPTSASNVQMHGAKDALTGARRTRGLAASRSASGRRAHCSLIPERQQISTSARAELSNFLA